MRAVRSALATRYLTPSLSRRSLYRCFVLCSRPAPAHQLRAIFTRAMSSTPAASTIDNTDDNHQKPPYPRIDRIQQIAAATELTGAIHFPIVSLDAIHAQSYECAVIFVTEDDVTNNAIDLSSLAHVIPSHSALFQSLMLQDFKGKAKATQFLYTTQSQSSESSIPRVLLVGLGKVKDLDASTFRSCVHAMTQALKAKSVQSALLHLAQRPPVASLTVEQLVKLIVRISLLSNHAFTRKTHSQELIKAPLSTLAITLPTIGTDSDIVSDSERLKVAMRSEAVIAECTILARELSNERADVATPSYIESVATTIAEAHSLPITVVKDDKLVSEGLTLISAVGQGAKENEKARIIVIEYNGAPTNDADSAPKERLALVGKGITFDTGGLNMKHTGHIEDMYMDKHGTCSVLSTLKALALLRPRINVVAALAVAENSVDAHSIKPHTIINTVKGSVEISNTDAEGRLALADTLTYVQRHYQPNIIIDIATLTGACVMALGEFSAGLFANNDALANELLGCSRDVQEPVWRMPVLKEHSKALEGLYSDFRSTGKIKGAGASVAAAFLQRFVDEGVKHAHLDIAGVGMASEQRDWIQRGGTGFGVQLMTDYIVKAAEQQQKAASSIGNELPVAITS